MIEERFYWQDLLRAWGRCLHHFVWLPVEEDGPTPIAIQLPRAEHPALFALPRQQCPQAVRL